MVIGTPHQRPQGCFRRGEQTSTRAGDWQRPALGDLIRQSRTADGGERGLADTVRDRDWPGGWGEERMVRVRTNYRCLHHITDGAISYLVSQSK